LKTMRRRRSRELALIFLYQTEIRGESKSDIDTLLNSFWQEQNIQDEEIMEFAGTLASGTLKNLALIDEKISASAINWSIRRMPLLDKNILRLAVFELLFIESMPVLVSINEAIELAKKYGADDSPRFVNGVLHKIKEGIKEKEVDREGKSKTPMNSKGI